MIDCPHNANWVYSQNSPFCKKCKMDCISCGKPKRNNNISYRYRATKNMIYNNKKYKRGQFIPKQKSL